MGGKGSCNVGSHETYISPASCAALYSIFFRNNVLPSCADVCTNGQRSKDAEIKHDGEGHVDKCYVYQLYLYLPLMHMATVSTGLH